MLILYNLLLKVCDFININIKNSKIFEKTLYRYL